MNKINLASGFAGLVLSAGLVSCSPEKKKELDTYKVDPPKVIRHSVAGVEALNLKAWSESPNKDLDLQDVIDVVQADAKTLDVRTNCRLFERDYFLYSKIANPKLLSLFQLVPSEILTADLEKSPVTCQFELVLSNEVGSRHVFALSSLRVRDLVAPNVAFEKDGRRLKERLRISATTSSNHRVRATHMHDQAQIECQEIRFPSMAFMQGLELSAFDFSKYELLPNHDAQNLKNDPVQLCRMSFFKNNVRWDISPLFYVTLQTPPLEKIGSFPLAQWPGTYQQASKSYRAFSKFIRGYSGADIGQFTLKNVDTYSRRLQIEKKALRGKISHFYEINSVTRARVHRAWNAFVQIDTPDHAQITEDEKYWTIILPAQSSVNIRILNPSPNPKGTPVSDCAAPSRLQALGYEVTDPIRISEMTTDGDIAYEDEIKLDKIYFSWSQQPLQGLESYREMSCSEVQRAN